MVTDRQWVVVYDTDLHGGLSGYIALRALRSAGEAVLRHYSHFEPVRPPAQPQRPVTNPIWLATSLPQIVQPGVADLAVIDIPINAQRPIDFVSTLRNYTIGGRRVLFIDHHGHSQWIKELLAAGVHVAIQPTSYDMSLYLPRILGVSDPELERLALIAALGDFDSSIAPRVDSELEETVTEYLDTAWKQGFRSLPDVESMAGTYGNVGAIVQYLLSRNVGPEGLLELARMYGRPVPLLQHEVRGEVVIATEQPPQGLAWKCAAKLTRVTGAPIAVVVAQTPRGISVIVAADWRRKDTYASVVDTAVEEAAAGRTVVGHSGARSILCTTTEEARGLQGTIVHRINELIASHVYTPKTVRLINEDTVARALHEDFRALMQKLAEILEEQRKMYREYLELKRKQVELLEHTQRREYD